MWQMGFSSLNELLFISIKLLIMSHFRGRPECNATLMQLKKTIVQQLRYLGCPSNEFNLLLSILHLNIPIF